MKNEKLPAVVRFVLLLLAFSFIPLALAEPFFLPPGEGGSNSGDPEVLIDSAGNLHMIYNMVASQGAVYAWCPADCASEEAVRTVSFDTADFGAVGTALIALDSSGRPHILLQAHEAVMYGQCLGDCTRMDGWYLSVIAQDLADWSINGQAFALDQLDRPRFVSHAYIGYLGMFSAEEGTRLWSCDQNCLDSDSWSHSLISEQNWVEATLLYDAAGAAHVAAVIPVEDADLVAYLRCDTDCGNEEVDNWPGVGLDHAFSDLYIEEVRHAVSMALSSSGGVSLAFIGTSDDSRYLVYYECPQGCTAADGSGWDGMLLLDGDVAQNLGDGIDLALDSQDRPRLAYTISHNISLGYCNSDCTGAAGADDWRLAVGELGGDIPADDIFLWHNCTVGMWFLRQPSVAITPGGLPVLAYRAEDISAGWTTPDISRPGCAAGVDMTMVRLNSLDSY